MADSPSDTQAPTLSWPRLLAGTVLGLAALALVGRQIDRDALLKALSGLALGWLVLACLVDLLAFGLRALKWRVLLGGSGQVRYLPVLRATVIGAMTTDVLPLRLDELVRAHLIGRHSGLPRSQILGTIAIERCLDVCMLLMLLGALAWTTQLTPQILTGGAVLLSALLLAGLLYSLGPRSGGGSAMGEIFSELAIGMRAARGRILAASAPWVLEWVALLAMFNLILIAFGLPGSGSHALAMLVASFLVFAFPITPGAAGVYEAAITGMLVARGLPPEQALAIALTAHTVVLTPTTLLGALFLAVEDLGLADLLGAVPRPAKRAA